MPGDDIESRFDLYIEAIYNDNVRYHHIGTSVLHQGDKKVQQEARYDTDEETIDVRRRYSRNDETAGGHDWTQVGDVINETTIVDPDGEWTESNLHDTMAVYIRSLFLSNPETLLGEVFRNVETS